jgi:hypothetical protein
MAHTCELCEYTTDIKSSIQKHYTSKKHINKLNNLACVCEYCNIVVIGQSKILTHKTTCDKNETNNLKSIINSQKLELDKYANELHTLAATIDQYHNDLVRYNILLADKNNEITQLLKLNIEYANRLI